MAMSLELLRNSNFRLQLAFGQAAETDISLWLQSRGHGVFPAYEVGEGTGKGPRIFLENEQLVAPDLFTFTSRGPRWVEAKHKCVFTWHRKSQRWTTGIDLHLYRQYLRVQQATGISVELLFLHDSEQPDARDLAYADCPRQCPTGLFGGKLHKLSLRENHRSERWGKGGMVYWSHDKLKTMASMEQMQALRNGVHCAA